MRADTRPYYVAAAQRVIEHIVANLDEALNLDSLAGEACLSPFHFHRVFSGMVGESPLVLVRRLRLERAAWQLAATAATVTQVAFDAGFETHESFTRAFRASYGASPSEYRRLRRPRSELAARCGVHITESGTVPDFIPQDTGGRQMQVEIADMKELRVAAVRHVGPYNRISAAFERLGETAARAGLFQLAGAQMVALYHDDPESTPPEELRSDAGIVVPEGVALPAPLTEHRLPAGRYARTTHIGPYEGLGDTWLRLMGEWLPASGHRVGNGASYELYVNDPRTTPKAELRTDILVSIV